MEITLKQDYFDTKFTYLFYFGPGSLLGKGGGIQGQRTKYLKGGGDKRSGI